MTRASSESCRRRRRRAVSRLRRRRSRRARRDCQRLAVEQRVFCRRRHSRAHGVIPVAVSVATLARLAPAFWKTRKGGVPGVSLCSFLLLQRDATCDTMIGTEPAPGWCLITEPSARRRYSARSCVIITRTCAIHTHARAGDAPPQRRVNNADGRVSSHKHTYAPHTQTDTNRYKHTQTYTNTHKHTHVHARVCTAHRHHLRPPPYSRRPRRAAPPKKAPLATTTARTVVVFH